MTVEKRYEAWFVVFLYAWIFALVIGVVRTVRSATPMAIALGGGCIDTPELPRVESCSYYMSLMRSVDGPIEVPSMTPADFGVRVIVAPDFDPLMGASYPVPGGVIAWNVWEFHWYDGDHLGAVGRVDDTLECRWFEPR